MLALKIHSYTGVHLKEATFYKPKCILQHIYYIGVAEVRYL